MTTTQPWHDLPNAVHIDRIIESLRTSPRLWARAAARWVWYPAHRQAREQAWHLAWAAEKSAVWHLRHRIDDIKEAWYSADARDAALHTTEALIAWPDCVYLLYNDAKQVKILALLGQPAAVLLYPACCALKSSNKSMAYSA